MKFIVSITLGNIIINEMIRITRFTIFLQEADKLMYDQKRKKKEKMKPVDYRRIG
ncbi:MAG: hypothetical protein U0586_14025 [Candidatus Brocadiaceae bacterium]